jgi:L-alanine-DL-glutamate epimerase-like enolase superfamily enzyme
VTDLATGSGARVGRLDVSAYTVPTDAPEADGTIAWDSTTLVLVEARAEGVHGIGWTYGPTACVDVVRERLAPLVVDHDVLDVTARYHAMADALRNDGRPGIGAMALSAVDTALWDLKARVLDLPLHRLLGAVRTEVPVYGSGGFTTYDEERLATELDQWAEAGFTAVKIKVGEDKGRRTGRDTARVRQVRRTMGPLVEVMVDANGAHDAKHAIAWFDEVADQGVTWFEEPVSSDDLAGLTRVRDAIHADVTAGEYGHSLPYFRQMLDAGAVDCLQVDVTRCGGITEWQRATALAAAHGVDVSGHCAPHLHAAVAAATPNLRHLEWFHDHARIEAMLLDGAAPAHDGVLPVRDEPGNGLTWRTADAERYRVR